MKKEKLLKLAVAGMITGSLTTATLIATHAVAMAKDAEMHEQHDCSGTESCEGSGACKGADQMEEDGEEAHDCSGENECKGMAECSGSEENA